MLKFTTLPFSKPTNWVLGVNTYTFVPSELLTKDLLAGEIIFKGVLTTIFPPANHAFVDSEPITFTCFPPSGAIPTRIGSNLLSVASGKVPAAARVAFGPRPLNLTYTLSSISF